MKTAETTAALEAAQKELADAHERNDQAAIDAANQKITDLQEQERS
jgi:hypothetical protein